MAIVAADIKKYLSGGASNTDPNASIGGAISTTEITDSSLHNLFDVVSGTEASSGDAEYRCFYIKNTHASLTWQTVKLWIQTTTPSTDSVIAIGLDPVGISGTATAPGAEGTAPTGVTFTSPTSEGAALTLPGDGNLDLSEYIAVWLRRTISSGAAAYSSDSVVLRAQGDTAA